MTVNVVTGFETIYDIMVGCLERENVENGLLEDVETIVNTYCNEEHIDEPVIWVTQHPTTTYRQADISQTTELTVPFEFDCGVYEVDLDDGFDASQNLANRVILAILKNWQTIQSEYLPGQRLIKNITLNTYSPVGYVDVTNKSDKVMVTGVLLDVNIVVNWRNCCKVYEQNKEEENNAEYLEG